MQPSAAERAQKLLLDGEVVAYDGLQTSFSRLQQRLGVATPASGLVTAYPVVYCVFDLLGLDDVDLTGRPLVERRARLVEAIRPRAALQLSEAWRGDSERRFAAACLAGWEGLIAKRADAPYVGGRSTDWLKLKCAWSLETPTSPFVEVRPTPRGTHWTSPSLVAEVGFAEWTSDGRLRQARFLGVRDDKTATDVIRESPK